MDLSPYLESLRRDLAAAAATGSAEVARAADLLSNAVDSSARLTLLEALSDAAAEITTKLDDANVEVRLRGREADLVVTQVAPAPATAAAVAEPTGDVARITLRLPEALKESVERAAAAEGVSVNAWLVRAITTAIHSPGPNTPAPGRASFGRRVTGFAQA